MASIGEMFVKLGFNIDNKAIDKFSKSTVNAVDNIGKITAGAAIFVAAMDRIVSSVAKGVNSLENFNAQTGLSINKLQSLQITSQLQNIGLSAQDVTSSVQSLQSNLAQIRLGQGNIAPFQMLGIDVMGQNAFGVLDQLREKIKGIDDMTATNLISQMGINPQMITVLRMSKDEFAGLNKEIALTADERMRIEKLGIEVKKIHMQIEALMSKTIAKNMPMLMRLAKVIENIVYAIKRMGLGLPILIIGLGGVLKMFNLLKLSTLGWTWALTSLFLLLDDYATWAKGGKSLFDYTGIQNFFDAINGGLNKLDKHADILNALGNLANIGGGAWAGANIGKLFGPQGMAIGAGIGALAGLGVDIYAHSQAEKGGASRNITQNNNINVHSNASDPVDVARAIQPQLDSATLNLDNGGR